MALLSSPTIEDLIQNVRNMLNQPSAANSFWTDEELVVYINEAIRRYFAEVVTTSEGEFTAVADLDIESGVETVALPDDFFKVKNLYRAVNDGFVILQYRNSLNSSYSTTDGGSGIFYPSYYLRGNSLVLRPVPNFTETAALRLEYIQFPETIVTGGDSLTSQVSPVFRDLIETYAVFKAKMKESLVNGVDTTTLAKQNLSDLFTAFQEVVRNRSNYPVHVQPFNPESE